MRVAPSVVPRNATSGGSARDSPSRGMLDRVARPLKDRALAPLVAAASPLHPSLLTALALAAGLTAAAAAAAGAFAVALGAWLLSRIMDGLDGPVARRRGQQSDLGGYLDIVSDFIVYAAVPLGIAAGIADRDIVAWPAAAFLLASFYINAVSWLYLAAILEKRAARGSVTDAPPVHRVQPTAIVMPEGLIAGTETVLFYCAFLLLPEQAPLLFTLMAVLVLGTALQRIATAPARLRR